MDQAPGELAEAILTPYDVPQQLHTWRVLEIMRKTFAARTRSSRSLAINTIRPGSLASTGTALVAVLAGGRTPMSKAETGEGRCCRSHHYGMTEEQL
ncbi:MAG: hypothetical protein DMG71_00010 [Acidobacteria bacterium]|nr:MAG: hypothetical protein DMG71_00010 [Acidobacteriota bacterium]